MEKRENILKNIIYIFVVFSLVYIFGLVIKLDMALILQVLLVTVASLIVKFLIFNPILIYIIIILSFFAIISINHYFPDFISPFVHRTTALLSNIFHNIGGRERIVSENILWFWGILIVLFSFVTVIIIFKKKKNWVLLPIYMSFFLNYWYNYTDAAFWMMVLFLFLFLILITLNKYDLEVFKKDKLSSPDYKDFFPPWIWTGVLYGIIIIILALSLPKTTNVIKWPWLKTKVYDTFPGIEDMRSSTSPSRKYGEVSYFDFALTGYESIPSKLGGPVKLSDKKIMTVYSDSPQYLRGNIKNRYTGNYWEILGSSLKDYRSGKDFSNLSESDKENYYEELDIKIKYNSFSSKTIFSPYRPSKVVLKDKSRLKVGKDYSLMTSNGIYKGESYSLVAQVPLAPNQLMQSDISYKRDDIIGLDKYLQFPEKKISEATKELTKNIVKGLDSDLEKAMALEEYLRKNYEYSLDVSIVPENYEFIDYFLFQEEKGYCTYYATTLAIMLRLEDIPSRYIEGYLVQDLKEEGIYEVTQENAHTWVEAFIEPIGWIRLEATPAYPISPRLSGKSDESTSEEMLNDSILPDRDVFEEGQKKENQEDTLNGHTSSYEDRNISEIESKRKRYFGIFLGLLFSILPLRFLFVFFKLKYKDSKIKKLSDRKMIIYLYDDIIKLIEELGYNQEIGETHREYSDRISFRFRFFHGKGVKEITEIFIKNKYGNSPVSKNDLLEMEKFKSDLKKRIKNSLGILGYLRFYLKI